MKIYTIGHSTRSLEDFVDILIHYDISMVIDVRRFPSSKKFPHFMREVLQNKLSQVGIEYYHLIELGGFRPEGYKKFSESPEFVEGIKKLLRTADAKSAAVLCAEAVWFRCHRRYIANKLAEMGHQVIHIYDKERSQEHKFKSTEIDEKMNLKIFCDRDDVSLAEG